MLAQEKLRIVEAADINQTVNKVHQNGLDTLERVNAVRNQQLEDQRQGVLKNTKMYNENTLNNLPRQWFRFPSFNFSRRYWRPIGFSC